MWQLVLISLIICQHLFNWQPNFQFHWLCKTACSKVTESLWQQVVHPRRLVVHGRQIQERTAYCKGSQWAIISTLQLELLGSSALGQDLSHHIVPQCLKAFGLKACSVVTKPLINRKNLKARKRRRTGPKFTSVMKASLIQLGPMGNIMFGDSLRRKTKPKVFKEISERWRKACHGLGHVFCIRRGLRINAKVVFCWNALSYFVKRCSTIIA